MKKSLVLLIVISMISACSVQNQITSLEYVSRPVSFVTSGNQSPEKGQLLLVYFNKYFNQERYSSDFISKNGLNTIDYRNNMAVEIFLGEMTNKIEDLSVDKIEENKDNIRVYFSFSELENEKLSQTPFIVVQTPKSRKPVIFYKNEERVELQNKNIYINN